MNGVAKERKTGERKTGSETDSSKRQDEGFREWAAVSPLKRKRK